MLKRKPKNRFTEEELRKKYPQPHSYRVVESLEGDFHVERVSINYDLVQGKVSVDWWPICKKTEALFARSVLKFQTHEEAVEHIVRLQTYPKYTYH